MKLKLVEVYSEDLSDNTGPILHSLIVHSCALVLAGAHHVEFMAQSSWHAFHAGLYTCTAKN